MNFFEKFFYQSNDSEYLQSLYGKGEGAFGYRHIIWIILTIILAVGLYQLFKRYKKAGKWFITIASIALFTVRVINQTYRGIAGLETPWYAAFPFHLCTLMTFIVPIVCLFDLKKIKSGVYGCAIMGGIITVLFGEYFDYKFMNFGSIEGIIAHMLLIYIPIVEMAIDKFHFYFKESYKTVITMLICCGWAQLANYVIFKDYNKNYMYLKKNHLPFSTGPIPFFLVYVVIFAIFLAIMYGCPTLIRNYKAKKEAIAVSKIIANSEIDTTNTNKENYSSNETSSNSEISDEVISYSKIDTTPASTTTKKTSSSKSSSKSTSTKSTRSTSKTTKTTSSKSSSSSSIKPITKTSLKTASSSKTTTKTTTRKPATTRTSKAKKTTESEY